MQKTFKFDAEHSVRIMNANTSELLNQHTLELPKLKLLSILVSDCNRHDPVAVVTHLQSILQFINNNNNLSETYPFPKRSSACSIPLKKI